MIDVEALAVDLLRDEGCVLHAYKDSEDFLTIGVGRLIDDRVGGGITLAEARYLLNNDITRTIIELDNKLPWWRDLPEPKARALANMHFNLGWPRLSQFKKMLDALGNGRWDDAAREALDSKWASQVGARAERIAEIFRR